jgi:mannosyltransferase
VSSSATRVRVPSEPPAASPAPRWSPVELLPVLVLLALGAVLLVRGHSLWYDELFTAEVVRLPLDDIVQAAVQGREIAPYLPGVAPSYNFPYYVVADLWAAVPGLGGDTSLRVFSLLATAGGLALVTRAVARLAGRPTGVLAGTVLAAGPLLLEQSVEARSYGLVLLATGGAVLGLVRWLQEPPRGLVLFGLAGTAMGLMHWFSVTVLAAFVVAALVLRRRAALPVVAVGALAVLPTLALVVMNLVNGIGGSNVTHLRSTGGRLPLMALDVWTGGRTALLVLLVVLMALGAARASGARTVATAWALLPLALVTLGDLVRGLWEPRYLLAGLLGVGVLAAAGAWSLPRPARVPVAALLVGLTLWAAVPVLEREPRERGEDMVALLLDVQEAGEPVVAGERRSALALDHYTRLLAPVLRADLVLPPDDAPPEADRVWLVHRYKHGRPMPTDDYELLRAAGLTPQRQWHLPASHTHFVLELWTR